MERSDTHQFSRRSTVDGFGAKRLYPSYTPSRVRRAALRPGEGAILSVHSRKVAAYRDDAGALHTLDPACRHMGCTVAWNPAEETWDCPCHGSRYRADGQVIHGPAVYSLEKKELEQGGDRNG